MEALLLLGWLVMCGVVAFIAKERGRGPMAWFFVALVLSPLIGYAILVAIPLLARVEVAGATPIPGWLDAGDDSPVFRGPRS